MKTLQPMTALDRGVVVDVNGEATTLCAPVFAFTGDMPQQQANSGCLGVTAHMGCRSCEVTIKRRGDLKFDIVIGSRGHFEMLRQRRHMDTLSTTDKRKYSTATGIAINPPAVMEIAPSLDLVSGRPSDVAYSEYGGISKMVH
jgi:hypothetical protein